LFLFQLSNKSFRIEVIGSLANNKIALGFIVLFICYVLSFALHFADYQELSIGLSDLEKKLSYLLLPILFFNVRKLHNRQVQLIFKVFVYAVALSTLIALLSGIYHTITSGSLYFYDKDKMVVFNNFMYHRLGSYVGMHAVYLAEYVLFALVILTHYSISRFRIWKTKRKSTALLLMLYFMLVIFLLKSAAILIILLASVILFVGYYLIKHGSALSLKFKLAIGAIAILLTLGLGYQALDKIGNKASYFSYDLSEPGGGNWNAINLRLAKWHAASLAVSEHWVLGVGPGNTAAIIDDIYSRIGFEYALQLHYNAHNQFLQTFLALGIFGITVFAGLIIIILINGLLKQDIVLLIFILSLGLFSISESILAVNKGIVFFALFTSIFSFLPERLSHYYNE
jgi:O-antigen ligase